MKSRAYFRLGRVQVGLLGFVLPLFAAVMTLTKVGLCILEDFPPFPARHSACTRPKTCFIKDQDDL